jgi:hypothetical protein
MLNQKFDKEINVAKMFKWVSDTRFKIINSDCIEKLFEITPDKKLKVISSLRLPYMKTEWHGIT